MNAIAPIKLLAGSHSETAETGVGCFMNVIAYLNGEPQITDQSPCVCYTVRPMAIFLNDLATDEQRPLMLPFILRAMGSATDDRIEISRRLALLVEFAQWQAGLAAKSAEYAAKSAEYAAKYTMYAVYAAKYAEYAAVYAAVYAAKYAQSAQSAQYAEYAAEYAAMYAVYAAKYAVYAAQYAQSAQYAEYAAYREITFTRGLALLDAMLPPMTEPQGVTVERIERLRELQSA